MKVLVILTPTAGAAPPEFERLRRAEEQAVWPLYVRGAIRELHFQPDPLKVLLTFEAESRSHAAELTRSLPMVEAGLFDLETIELGPWLPFAALFERGVVEGV